MPSATPRTDLLWGMMCTERNAPGDGEKAQELLTSGRTAASTYGYGGVERRAAEAFDLEEELSVELAGEAAISNVLTEALEEISGESKHRWGLMVVVALVVGGMAALVVVRLRARKGPVAAPDPGIS